MSDASRQLLYRFPPFHLRSDVDLLFRGEDVVPLERQAVRVLRYLVENHERVVPKEELHDAVWRDVFTTDAVLKNAVSQVRRALGDNTRLYIKTFHARGYRFVAPVMVADATAAKPERAPLVPAEAETPHPNFDQLVGRDGEMTALLTEYASAKTGKGRPVIVTGDAGIGKSQLAHYFGLRARDDGALCLEARFFDYQASHLAPFELFLDLLRQALGLDLTSYRGPLLAEAARTRLGVTLPEGLFRRVEGDRSVSSSGEGDVFRAVIPICECFVRLSRTMPLVMILDDLHWADASSLEVIGYLMRTAERERIMLLGAMRSDESRRPDSAIQEWLRRQAGYRGYTTLSLGPLSEASLRLTIEAVFGGPKSSPQIPAAEFAQIFSISGGNPYFFAEMLRLLVSQGALTMVADPSTRWSWRGTKDLRLPENLVTAAKGRLDGLSSEVRELIDAAAVIGEEFRIGTLAALAGRDPVEVEELLGEALDHAALSDQRLSRGEDRRFAHAILRRVVYDAIPQHRRRALHERAARALQEVYAFEGDRVAAGIGEHCEEAGLNVETFLWSMRAGQVAAGRWQWRDAATNLERAARALQRLGETEAIPTAQRMAMMLALGEALLSLGRLRDSERILESALELATTSDDAPSIAAAYLKLGQTRIGLSRYRDALIATERAHALSMTLHDEEGTRRALVQIGTCQVAMGDYESVDPVIEQVLQTIDERTEGAALAQEILGWARALRGRYAEAVKLLERAAEYYKGEEDFRRYGLLLRRLHWIALSRGELERAVALAVEARDRFRVVGDAIGEAKLTMGIAQARIAQGLCEEGIAHLHKTLEIASTMGARHCEGESLWLLGRAYRDSGRPHEAEALLRRALEIIREIGDRDDEFRILIDLASTRLTLGDAAGGQSLAELAGRIARELRNESGAAMASLELSRTARMSAENSLAIEHARRAAETLERCEAAERWYGWWMLGQALADSGDSAGAVEALRHSVALVDGIVAEIPDAERKRIAAAARAGPAEDLTRLAS